MAQITTNINRRQFPAGAPAVRQPYYQQGSSYNAQAQFFQSAANLAFGIATREQKAYYDSEMAKGTTTSLTLLNELDELNRKEPSPENYIKNFQETFEKIKAIAPTIGNNRAQIDFLQKIELSKPKWEADINKKADLKRRDNVISNAALTAESITKSDPRDPSQYNGMLESITETISALTNIGYTNNEINQWSHDRVEDMEKRTVLLTALEAIDGGGYEQAQKIVNDSSLEAEDKRQVIGLVRSQAAQNQAAYDAQVEQKDVEYLQLLRKESLTELQQKIDSDLASGAIPADLAKEYYRYHDAIVNERLKGEGEVNYDRYDELQEQVEKYKIKELSKQQVRDSISEAVKSGEITTTLGISLRNKLDITDDPTDPLNRTAAKRAQSVLNEFKSLGMFRPDTPDDASYDDKKEATRQNYLTYLRLTNELESWIKSREKEPTDEEITNKINELTQFEIEKDLPSRISRFFDIFGAPTRAGMYGISILDSLKNRQKKTKQSFPDLQNMSDEELRKIIEGEK